ncbi:PP2C family protein-serine/threonine phosphatase [Kitasatospora sp. NPDC056184]|uniref:PP2C family protein-serine/threonine phosphatase n=1 Tax=Kitasatospora sp. NPDC056184 TaxID=3345738 RepID=UPI0035DE3BA4
MTTIGIAQREGTAGPIADAAATYTSDATGHTAVALVDGMGHDPDIVRLAPMLAETAARVGAARGPLAGLLSAGLLVNDPGPDGVGVLAVVREDGSAQVVWAGDCRAYRWVDGELQQLTTDHNLAAYLTRAARGAGEVPVAALADYVGVTLGLAVPATAPFVGVPAGGTLILTSDGVHDQVPADLIEELVRKHASDPQALADALVAAASSTPEGYRDDATAVVVAAVASPAVPDVDEAPLHVAMQLGRMAATVRDLPPGVRGRVEQAIEQAMQTGAGEAASVCALLDTLLDELVAATRSA